MEVGFDACGIARIEPIDSDIAHLTRWLEQGYAASLGYMHKHLTMRANPRELLPSAQSMVMVLLNYCPTTLQPDNQPTIARYAYGNDYHHIVKSKLRLLAEKITALAPENAIEFAPFCDSAPVLERVWAARAGLGWIGKNSMLINPKLGTHTFIGTLITSLTLEPDTPMASRCGNCHACIDACPTQALREPYIIDARNCVSFHTIESRNHAPQFNNPIADNTLFGCDCCHKICPWNRFSKPHNTAELMPIEGLFNIDWNNITRSEFKNRLKNSAMQRAGYQKLRDRARQIEHFTKE